MSYHDFARALGALISGIALFGEPKFADPEIVHHADVGEARNSAIVDVIDAGGEENSILFAFDPGHQFRGESRNGGGQSEGDAGHQRSDGDITFFRDDRRLAMIGDRLLDLGRVYSGNEAFGDAVPAILHAQLDDERLSSLRWRGRFCRPVADPWTVGLQGHNIGLLHFLDGLGRVLHQLVVVAGSYDRDAYQHAGEKDQGGGLEKIEGIAEATSPKAGPEFPGLLYSLWFVVVASLCAGLYSVKYRSDGAAAISFFGLLFGGAGLATYFLILHG